MAKLNPRREVTTVRPGAAASVSNFATRPDPNQRWTVGSGPCPTPGVGCVVVLSGFVAPAEDLIAHRGRLGARQIGKQGGHIGGVQTEETRQCPQSHCHGIRGGGTFAGSHAAQHGTMQAVAFVCAREGLKPIVIDAVLFFS